MFYLAYCCLKCSGFDTIEAFSILLKIQVASETNYLVIAGNEYIFDDCLNKPLCPVNYVNDKFKM